MRITVHFWATVPSVYDGERLSVYMPCGAHDELSIFDGGTQIAVFEPHEVMKFVIDNNSPKG